MTFHRARVALSLPVSCPSKPIPTTANRRCVHIGHARTLLLGSLIAREAGCPFHIRFDGPPYEQGGGEVGDRGEAILDTTDCLAFLGIEPDRVYWNAPGPPNDGWLRDRLGERFDLFRKVLSTTGYNPEYYQAQMCDDLLVNAPSLIVRGREFVEGRPFGMGPEELGTLAHAAREDVLFSVAGQEKHEVNVPMVTVDEAKMSKTLLNGIHWTVLTSASGDLTRRFLIATALHAQDPLSALDWPFATTALETRPYAWSWQAWGDLVRRSA